MEFLNPKQQRRHTIQLYIGYALVGIAIIIATTILLYQAYGFGLDKNGQVIQNGLLYLSSQPGGADITLNGTDKGTTNSRFNVPAGQYAVSLKRDGYRDWNRQVTVDGGAVARFDYPFLFPDELKTTSAQTFETAPLFTTESPSRRWLLMAQPNGSGTGLTFIQRDLQNPTDATTSFSPPATIVAQKGADSWQVIEWANDNRHALIKHNFEGGLEYILLDRQTPAQSINLSTTLDTTVSDIRLLDKRADTFVLYDAATQVVSKVSLKNTTPVTFAERVIAFQTYGDNTLLFVTAKDAPAGKVRVLLKQDGTTYQIRTLASDTQYQLDLTQYEDALVVAAGATSEDKVYLYQDPIALLTSAPKQILVPVSVLKVTGVNYLAFSSNTQFVLAENGNRFSVYDVKNEKTYNYDVSAGLDAPQTNARWMDGNRLTYISGGKLRVIDFDNNNAQSLMALDAGTLPYFDTGYEYVYSYGTVNGVLRLQSTPLRTAADL